MMLVLTSFKGLIFQNKVLEVNAVTHLKHLMQSSQMREGLLEVMAEVGTGMRQIYQTACFEQLADVINFILTLFVHENVIDPKLLYTIMIISGHIYMKRQDEADSSLENKRKIYLYMRLNNHEFWLSHKAWTRCIQHHLVARMDNAKERLRRREQMEIENEKKTFSLKKFAFATSKLQGLIKSKDEQMREDLKDFSNMVFDEVSTFITFFINFNLPFRLAKTLL